MHAPHYAKLLLVSVALLLSGIGLRAEVVWLHARSPHFEVYSSGSQTQTSQYVCELERMREVCEGIFHLKFSYEGKTLVIICSREREMKSFLSKFKGKSVESSGLCVGPVEIPALILQDTFGTDDTKSTIYHEYAHMLLERCWGDVPLWYNEGFAQVMGALEITSTHFVLGKYDLAAAACLRDARRMPFEKMLGVTQGSSIYNEDPERSVFYAQSWAFVHMCYFGKENDFATKLETFARRSGSVADKRALFERCFGMPLEKVEKLFRGYTRAGRYVELTGKLDPQKEGLVQFVPCGNDEVTAAQDAVLARIHDWREDPLQRNRLIAELEKVDGATAPFLKEMGALLVAYLGDPDAAAPLEDAAIAQGTTNPRVWSQKIDRLMKTYGYGLEFTLPEESSAQFRALVDKAMEANPKDPELLRQLAWVETYSSRARRSKLNILETEYAVMEKPGTVRLLLAIMRWRYDDPKTALAFIDGVTFEDKELENLADLLREKIAKGEKLFRPKKLVIPGEDQSSS